MEIFCKTFSTQYFSFFCAAYNTSPFTDFRMRKWWKSPIVILDMLEIKIELMVSKWHEHKDGEVREGKAGESVGILIIIIK